MNKLYLESSPYLLQHATNPVYWLPYNHDSLQKAKDENKLVIISIGYSTCHWCHVMEHESFENEDVATIMNDHYISIKIDREELPDIDAFYMKAVQLMTQQGGWPLNVVCLPDGRPIWGGTYFTKEKWSDSLLQLNDLYRDKPQTVLEYAEQLHTGISLLSSAPTFDNQSRFNFDGLLHNWKKSFDLEFGGYNRAPKFMMPTNLLFLQKYGILKQDKDLIDYIDLTLTKIAWGGIFDVVEGGFSRYSVDYKWHIPHFEKMLYDNAQLLQVYADAYKRTHNVLYKETIQKTISFIENNWRDSQGGYYSAYDADSLDQEGKLQEGAYYVWTKEELQTIITERFDVFSTIYNINNFGYWENNNYVFIQTQHLSDIANEFKLSLDEIQALKTKWESDLLSARNKRELPRIDNKILIAWNAMYIVGLLDCYTALNEDSYLTEAIGIFNYIQSNLINQETERLYHSSINGQKSIEAYVDDYAFFIQACLNLFENTANQEYLRIAKNSLDYCLDTFYDQANGFFFLNNERQEFITPIFETEDNVIPSSNAIMCMNLLKLGVLFENMHYTTIAKRMNQVMLSQIDYPSAYSHWLLSNLYIENPQELTIVSEQALDLTKQLNQKPIAKTFIFPINSTTTIPYLNKGNNQKAHSLYYFCTGLTCLAPEEDNRFLDKYTL
ncbi:MULTISPECIES: thioredoxin domain-containing protein [Myroides]|uniref:DUF255 domain-containing protein n=1 Tax=Myroides albus TaxID=2562892 RepID=A0A6I3LLG4_9FLAO|nr:MULTISPECIES: thioredoxin domain-containing protein [Myroides]MTG96825.1 DUF255 domain-containing protein [Myroides albus]MVX36930.1 DUF255 domain-containing protein [Myroides sp. LoEW2-1]UVD78425.1 thioredoxin domain-containing protein [Myroides albus]